MFQTPLSFVEFIQSASRVSSGILPDPLLQWDDTTDLSNTTSLPRIFSERFNFTCHLGIIAIAEIVCADTWDEALDRLCKLTPLFVFPCVEHV